MRHLRHANLELMYLSTCTSRPVLGEKPDPFSAFNDKQRYAGTNPSVQYCKSVFVDFMRSHRVFFDRAVAALPGRILKGDHTFKVSYNWHVTVINLT